MKVFMEFSPLGNFNSHTHKLSLGSHLCNFYNNEQSLLETFCNYIVPGLARGDGVILIVTPTHLRLFQEALKNRSIDFSKAIANGQLVIRDADMILAKIMKDDLPDPELFQKEVGVFLEEAQNKFPFTRAFGEMVDILWQKKNLEGALLLETLWNQALQDFNFTLLCSYSEDAFHKNANGTNLNEVCSYHSHLIFSDGELLGNT